MNTTIQIRVDGKMKREASKAFKGMGLDLSSGVKLFLHQVVKSQTIPFQISMVDSFTPAQARQIIKETKEVLKSGKSYTSIEELHADLLK